MSFNPDNLNLDIPSELDIQEQSQRALHPNIAPSGELSSMAGTLEDNSINSDSLSNQNSNMNSNDSIPLSKTNLTPNVKTPSNEFVRKLYNILESNVYPDIVRWTNTGDSFVVLDTGKFTTQILPNHFKHSNFASFVRQLNKYDFHKIKRKPNEGTRSTNGELSWEFKHPYFKIHDESALDHIKRKLTNTKRNGDSSSIYMGVDGVPSTSRQIGLTKEQLLSHTVSRDTFNVFRKRVDSLEKQLTVCKNEVFIGKVENQKLNSKYNTVVESLITFKAINENLINNFNILCSSLMNNGIKIPETLFDNASLCRNPNFSVINNSNTVLDKDLNQSDSNTETPNNATTVSSTNNNNNTNSTITSNTSNSNIIKPNMQLPLLGSESTADLGIALRTGSNDHKLNMIASPNSVKNQEGSADSSSCDILRKGFHVLLVEDDAISIQLCSKFLRKYGCTVEVVTDGLSAISTLEKFRFDLVLMDIVMPNLDGATATSIVRSFDNQTPIIAMTGNIEDQDLITYLQHGMNDILAKPFTRDDLHTMLVRYLRDRIPLREQPLGSNQNNGPQMPLPQDSGTQSPQNIPPTHQPHMPSHLNHDHNNNHNNISINVPPQVNSAIHSSSHTNTPQSLLQDENFLSDEHLAKKQHI